MYFSSEHIVKEQIMPYYMTPKGKRDNELRLMGYVERQKKLHREVQDSPARASVLQPSGTRDVDHIPEDLDILRDVSNIEMKIVELRRRMAESVIVPQPVDATLARIGCNIVVQRYSMNFLKIGEPEIYHIVGFEETDLKTSPPSLSYTSPLIRDMLGCTVDPDGEFYEVQLSGETIYMELVDIRLPNRAERLRLSSAA